MEKRENIFRWKFNDVPRNEYKYLTNKTLPQGSSFSVYRETIRKRRRGRIKTRRIPGRREAKGMITRVVVANKKQWTMRINLLNVFHFLLPSVPFPLHLPLLIIHRILHFICFVLLLPTPLSLLLFVSHTLLIMLLFKHGFGILNKFFFFSSAT